MVSGRAAIPPRSAWRRWVNERTPPVFIDVEGPQNGDKILCIYLYIIYISYIYIHRWNTYWKLVPHPRIKNNQGVLYVWSWVNFGTGSYWLEVSSPTADAGKCGKRCGKLCCSITISILKFKNNICTYIYIYHIYIYHIYIYISYIYIIYICVCSPCFDDRPIN